MYGSAGLLYVYSIHSRWCLNVVTEREGVPSAVLIRAVEPLTGIDLMSVRRRTPELLDLARGPARLCEAFAVDRRLNGWDLTRGERIWLGWGSSRDQENEFGTSPRIGVTSAQDLELRFFVDGSRYVSGLRRFHSRELV
jgi:DNA-3-methyladenine glycosylase